MTQENHLRSDLGWKAARGSSVSWARPEVGGGVDSRAQYGLDTVPRVGHPPWPLESKA